MSRWMIGLAVVVCAIGFGGGSPLGSGEPNRFPPCYSIRESKFRGCYVCSVSIKPNTIRWKGKEIGVKEAWLEKQQERGYLSGPLRSRLGTTNGYYLCITLAKGWDAMGDAMFVLEGRGKSLGAMGTAVLWDSVDPTTSYEWTMYCTDYWQFKNSVKLHVSLDRPFVASKK